MLLLKMGNILAFVLTVMVLGIYCAPERNYYYERYRPDDDEFRRGSCIPLGASGCEANNGKCCRDGDPYTGTMRKCVNEGSFSAPKYICREAKRDSFRRGSCIPLGGSGCEANNGKCCRDGDPYTGTMRKCVNEGSFSAPKYVCREAKRDSFRRGSCIPLGGSGCEANNGKCCRDGDPYTGTMRKCVNEGSFSASKYVCREAKRDSFRRGSCIPLGGIGCEANNGKCCRDGDPYTGTMRNCVNEGSFSAPKYVCREKSRDNPRRGACVPLGGAGCEANNGKCCRKGDPYTGTMRQCVNEGSFSSPNYVCREKSRDNPRRGACVPLGGAGCEANNGKCCRKGDPYTGTMRRCVNEGSFSSPKYVCRD